MELEDLKKKWNAATMPAAESNILSGKMITKMAQKKYQSKIKVIKIYELAGAVICVTGIYLLLFNFHKLDTVLLQATGILTILLLISLPVLSYLSLERFRPTVKFDRPYIEIVKEFAVKKLKFLQYQKLNALLCYLLLVTTIILLPKFSSQKNITIDKLFWILSFCSGYIVLLFFSKWVKKHYGNLLKQAEESLNESED